MLVEEALKTGLKVTALSRQKNSFEELNNPNLEVVYGDLFNFEDVEKAVKGSDAVLTAYGHKVNFLRSLN